jgi:ubiquinone/menaquinone biosynthesis C-methylase UbiE
LNDLEEPAQAIGEFSRVLSPDGRIVIMMLHPCFYNKHDERDQQSNNTIASTYFQTRSATQNFVVDGITSPSPNTAWIRPLEFYTSALQEAGFAIRSLSEPHPSEQQLQDSEWWRASFTRPLFMLIVAQRWPQ